MLSKIFEYFRHRLFRRPIETFAILATLAFGIGLLGAVLSLLEALIHRPMTSFTDAERVLQVVHQRRPEAPETGQAFQPLSLDDFRALERDTTSFSHIAAGQAVRVLLRHGQTVERVNGAMVSSSFFPLAGVEPVRGRFFHPDEDAGAGSGPVVVLAHAFWRSRFAGDPEIVGRRILLNDADFEVVGIAPAGFLGSNRLNPADFWVPISMYRKVFVAPQLVERRDGRFLVAWVRLSDGVGLQAATSELELIADGWSAEWPVTHGTLRLASRPLAGGPPTGFQKGLGRSGTLLVGAAAALLGLGCLNVANLQLVRARSGRREVVLRRALGASTRRLAIAELTDALVLALLGGLLASVVAYWTRQLLWSLRPPYLDERVIHIDADLDLLATGIAISLVVGIVFAAIPVLATLRRVDLAHLAKTTAAAEPRSPGARSWTTGGQIFVHVALSTLLLGLASLFLAGLEESRKTELGFEADGMVIASFDLQLDSFEPERQRDVRRQLEERLRALPGVESVGIAENRLLGGFRLWREVRAASGTATSTVGSGSAEAGFFDAAGLELVAGRDLAAGDGTTEEPGVVVNLALADQVLGGVEGALARQLVVDGTPHRVVGIVEDSAIMAPGEEPMPFLYLPLERDVPSARFSLHVRTSAGADGEQAALTMVRTAVTEVAPTAPIERLGTVRETISEALWLERLSATLLGGLALVGLLIAAIGVYAVSTADSQARRREVGVRMAIGATRRQIFTTVLRQGSVAVVLGVGCGLLLVSWSHGLVRGLLYDAGPPAAVNLVTALAVLVLLGGTAHVLPAWRAATMAPAQALRDS